MKETKWEVIDSKDCVNIINNGSDLIAHMKTSIWSYLFLKSNQFPCEENKIYKFQIESYKSNTDFRILIQFYGEEGSLGYRRYIDSGEEFCVPEKMNCFDVTAVISTDTEAIISLGKINYEYVGMYKSKNVRMCAISDDMLTSEMKVNQSTIARSYCKIIDEIVVKEAPDIVVLTETFHDRCEPELELKERFIDYNHEAITLISEKAKEHGIYIAASYHILENGCRYNRAILFDRKGKMIAEYDKSHPTVMERDWGMKPGNDVVVIDTEIGKLGLIICYDLYFPEFLRMYHLAECDILIWPTRGNARQHNNAAAINTGACIISASFNENNKIYDKSGNVIAESGEKGYAVATVDLNKPVWRPFLSVGLYHGEARDVFKYDRRPDVYGMLTQKNI